LKIFSDGHSKKAEHWFSLCQWDYCRFGLQKKCALDGYCVSLCPKL